MKNKQQTYNTSSNKNKQHNNTNNNKKIHKEFELLYRARQGITSSDQYQSVFFMKHHKITAPEETNKDKSLNKKKASKQKKKSAEKHINSHKNDKVKQKKEKSSKFTNTNTTVPFMGEAKSSQRVLFSDSFRETINLSETKLKKITHSSNSNTSRYLHPRYHQQVKKPSKSNKIKIQCPQLNRDFMETKKISSRGASKISSPKNPKCYQKRKNKQVSVSNKCRSQSQYVFFDGEFRKASQVSIPILDINKKTQTNHRKLYQENQFLQTIFTQKNNQDAQEYQRSQFSAVQQFLISKVIKIQRWWKNVLNKRKTNIEAYKPHFQHSNSFNLDSYMQKHEQTILQVMNSHKKILNQLRENDKLTSYEYAQKMSQIQSNFQKQMLQISQLRGIINNQVHKISKLEQKLIQQNNIVQNISKLPKEQILATLFQTNKENYAPLVPENRRKATGCHIGQSITTPIHSIPQMQREIFEKQSSDSNQQVDNEHQQAIILSNNLQGSIDNFLSTFQDQQQIQSEIQKRYAIQVGMAPQQFQNQNGISTSVLSIHNFMTSFLKFYGYFYKDQFLKLVNMPYGYNIKTRIRNFQKPSEELVEVEEDGIIYGLNSIISDQALEDYHQHNYASLDMNNKELIQMINYEKIHNRAILDSFNESLNYFRPYYYVGGPPYMWNYSQKALTFYFIAEENIQEVFEKTQYKVLRNASFLCGMHIDKCQNPHQITEDDNLQDTMNKYRNSINPILFDTREQKLNKLEKLESEEQNFTWNNIEQQKTSLLLDISNIVLVQLLLEASCEIPFNK